MRPERFHEITSRYAALKLAVVGDFCLDRYLEIDPSLKEMSIETGLLVYNVVRVRNQPGGAGTILNNLSALGVGTIHVIGFAGDDGEGFELQRALRERAGANDEHFVQTSLRRTFTYCKPLLVESNQAPVELNRLDSKNWERTPALVEDQILKGLRAVWPIADGVVLLDQVDVAETGVITQRVLEVVDRLHKDQPNKPVLADSRRGLNHFPAIGFKMNMAELTAMTGEDRAWSVEDAGTAIAALAMDHRQPVVVTMAEQGIVGADAEGHVESVPALPLRGPVDIVGAGDAVTANLIASLAAGASLREAMELANAAASLVIHQLGTTGTATIEQLKSLLQSR